MILGENYTDTVEFYELDIDNVYRLPWTAALDLVRRGACIIHQGEVFLSVGQLRTAIVAKFAARLTERLKRMALNLPSIESQMALDVPSLESVLSNTSRFSSFSKSGSVKPEDIEKVCGSLS
jgi:hypothetical protein